MPCFIMVNGPVYPPGLQIEGSGFEVSIVLQGSHQGQQQWLPLLPS